MTNVQFEEDNVVAALLKHPEPSDPGLTGMVVNAGIAKDPSQANVVFVIVSVLCIAASVYFFWPKSASDNLPPPHMAPMQQQIQ